MHKLPFSCEAAGLFFSVASLVGLPKMVQQVLVGVVDAQ